MENNEDREPIGVLFDTINYYSIEDLEVFISKLEKNQSLYCLTEAVKSAYRRNAFSIEEAEVISKCLRKLSFNSVKE